MDLIPTTPTRFTFIEYQALLLVLAFGIFAGLVSVEFGLRRFQVLPVLFPGMFSVRERRFFFFDFEVTDGRIAERLRSQMMVLARMTLSLVMSYLWQHCIMETRQQVGKAFPHRLCELDMDCFAAELSISALLTRKYSPVDCTGPREPSSTNVVISCIRFVKPSATDWLMHLAIAHAIVQLNIKSFEVCVQFAGNSRYLRVFLSTFLIIFPGFLVGSWFAGIMHEFLSSWLAFVMTFSVPIFLYSVWATSQVYQDLWECTARDAQRNIEEQLQIALQLLPGDAPRLGDVSADSTRSLATKARNWITSKAPVRARDWIMSPRASSSSDPAAEDAAVPRDAQAEISRIGTPMSIPHGTDA